MRRLCPAVALLCGLFLLSCSDDSGNQEPWPDGGKQERDQSTIVLDGRSADLGEEPDLITEEGGPAITVLVPEEAGLVIGETLEVRAQITDEDGVDDPTVNVTLQGGAEEVPMTVTTEPNVYRALIDISAVTGSARLWVTAQDLLGKKTSKVVNFERDPGPVVLFLSPTEQSRHKGSVSIQIAVADRVEVTSFDVRIGTKDLTLEQTVSTPERAVYAGTIKFDDPIFPIPLTGTQVITATAVNVNGAKTEVQRVFVIDNEGPTIELKELTAGDLIGGVLPIEVEVADEAGVVESSVKCIIGNNLDQRLVTLRPDPVSPGMYLGQFDTRTLPQNVLWPVMSFRAADELGNESHFDIEVGLDNGQPRVDLDPPNNMVLQKWDDQTAEWQCSHYFDPVGDDAASDGEVVPQIATVRVRIEDQGNDSVVPSAEFWPVSGIDDTTTKLFVLDDTSKPLVVDTTGDGFCDAINPEVVPLAGAPSADAAVAVNLDPVPKTGSANFTPWATDAVPAVGPNGCPMGDEEDAPDALCETTEVPAVHANYQGRAVEDMSLALWHTTADSPSVYGPTKVDPGDIYRCTGLPFDFRANQFADGWVCLAAVARDNLGLVGVSKPMRLYVLQEQLSYAKGQNPPTSAGQAPDCTGTLDKATGRVNNTPCEFRASDAAFPQLYEDAEIRRLPK